MKIILIFDFDGVLYTSINEPLLSSIEALGLKSPTIIDKRKYLSKKGVIASIKDLYEFIKEIRNIDTDLETFKKKLFAYRKKVSTSMKYQNNFSKTPILLLLKLLKNRIKCFIVTSRDISTVKELLKKDDILNCDIYSSSELNSSKKEIINKLLKENSFGIFVDDMKKNLTLINKNNTQPIHKINHKNKLINVLFSYQCSFKILIAIISFYLRKIKIGNNIFREYL